MTVIGKITQMSSNGMELKLQLADGEEAKVQMEDPLPEFIEGYIQLIARVNRDYTLIAEHYVSFGTGEMDLDAFNKALGIMSRHPNFFSTSEVNGIIH